MIAAKQAKIVRRSCLSSAATSPWSAESAVSIAVSTLSIAAEEDNVGWLERVSTVGRKYRHKYLVLMTVRQK
jgi:hypothetical protein